MYVRQCFLVEVEVHLGVSGKVYFENILSETQTEITVIITNKIKFALCYDYTF